MCCRSWRQHGKQGEEVLATVLICGDAGRSGEQRMGMVVRQVLDVSAGTLLERDAISDEAGMELALVKEKLTLVHREFGREGHGLVAGGCVRDCGSRQGG